MRSRLLMPTPQVMLQGSHSPHSVTTQLLGAVGITKYDNIRNLSTTEGSVFSTAKVKTAAEHKQSLSFPYSIDLKKHFHSSDYDRFG